MQGVKRKPSPVHMLWARGSPAFLSFASPSGEGVGAPTRRMVWISPDRPRSALLLGGPGTPGPGRETSRPAPCGAPTRHLGLYAFDRGRTGPGRSARRGCPSTARGRGCVLHRSQVPLPFPAVKTPPEGAPRRVDRDRLNIITLKVKSSIIFTLGVCLYGERSLRCRPRESGPSSPFGLRRTRRASARRSLSEGGAPIRRSAAGTVDENSKLWWLWVPAFAGTTAESHCLTQSKRARRNWPTHSSTKTRTLLDISRVCG